jgi:alpha-1,2-mannosyltransferase
MGVLRALLLLAMLAVVSFAAVRAAAVPQVTDFHCFWTAARMVQDGANPYDAVAWVRAIGGPFADASGAIRAAPCPGAFGYPLWTAIAFLPLAALPEGAAAVLWAVVSVAAAALGVALCWSAAGGRRDAVVLLAVIVGCSQPLWLTLINAQFGGVLLGAMGVAAFGARTANDRLAGVALGVLTLKPHVASVVFVDAAVRAWRERRPVAIAVAAVVGGALAIAALIAQPGWPSAWAAELLGTRREMLPRQATAWTLAADTLGDARIGAVFIVLVVAGALWALRGTRLSSVERLSLAVCASLLVTPYAGSHDQLLLALPWAMTLVIASPLRSTALLGAILGSSSLLPWVLYAYALRARPDEATAWLVTAATTLTLSAAIRMRVLSASSSAEVSSRARMRERPMPAASLDS